MFETKLPATSSTLGALAQWLRTYFPVVLSISIWAVLGVAVVATVVTPLGQVFATRSESSGQPSAMARATKAAPIQSQPFARR
jgi:hypothetical protein